MDCSRERRHLSLLEDANAHRRERGFTYAVVNAFGVSPIELSLHQIPSHPRDPSQEQIWFVMTREEELQSGDPRRKQAHLPACQSWKQFKALEGLNAGLSSAVSRLVLLPLFTDDQGDSCWLTKWERWLI